MSVVLNLDTEAIQITGIASGGAGTLSDGGFKNCFTGIWVYRESATSTFALTNGASIIHYQSAAREVSLGFNSVGTTLADLNLQMIYNSGGGAGTPVLFTGHPGNAYLDEWVYYFIAENPTDGQIAGYIRAADLATAITLSRANDNATSQYINTLTFGNFSGNTAVVAGRYAYGRAAYDPTNGFNVADALAFAASAVPTGDWGFWRLANNTDTADTSGNGRTITFVGTLDTAGDPPLAVPQFARPASDNVDGSWTPSTGGDLFACIDETPFSDTDYISATANTSGKVNLSTLSTPVAGTQTARLRASGSPAKRLIARLIEGVSTVRGSVTVDPLTSTVTAYSFSPSGISNYADLDFEFEIQDATSPPANNPSYNALGAAANVTSTTTVTVSYPSMTGANSSTALYLIATGRSNTAATEFAITGGGWTNIGTLEGGTGTWGADAGTRRVTVFRKDTVTGSESGTVTLTLAGTTANTLYGSIVRVDAPAAGYTLTQSVVSGADTSAGTAVSITASSTLDYAANDLILVCHASPSDTGGVVGSPSLTASGSTFGSLTSRASIAVTGGNDHRHVVYSAVVTAAGSAAAPVFAYTASGTNSGNASGPAIFVRIRSTAPTEFARVTFAEVEVPANSSGSYSDSTTEAASAGDSSTALVIYNASSTEAAAASDTATSPGGPQSDSVTEAVVLSETQSSTFSTSASATEAASAGDSSSYPAGSAVPSLIAAVSNGSFNGTSALTSQINTTGATQIRVYISCQVNNLTNGAVTDNKGNSYEIESGPTTIGTFPGYAYVFRPTAAPTVGTGHEFSASGGAASYPSIFVAAVGPSAGGTVSVAAPVVTQDPSRPYISGNVTPSQPNALLVGFAADDATGANLAWSWSSPSSAIAGTAINDANSFWCGILGQRSVTSSGTYTMEATNSGTGGQGVVAVSSFTETTAGGTSHTASQTDSATASESAASTYSTAATRTEAAAAAETSDSSTGNGAAATEAASASETSSAGRGTSSSITEQHGGSVTTSAGNYNNDYDLDGAGTSPQTVTISSYNGKSVLLLVLGNRTQQATPTDNQGNSYASALLRQNGYAGGLWDPYDMRVYGLATANGGATHTFSVTKTDTVRESTLVAVATDGDIIQSHSIVARAAAGVGANHTSAPVTTTGPALLVAFWSGDGGVALGSLDAAPQTGTGWTMPIGVFLESTAYIQHAFAYKQVTEPGSYTITWTHVDNQGAILFLAAIQSSAGGVVDVSSVIAAFNAARVEAASASETAAAAMATLAARVEAASAAESAAGQAARGASVTEPAAATEQSSTSGLSQNDSVTETATAAEAGAATFTTSATRTEAASATDTSVTDAGTSDSVSEAAVASDASASTYSTQAARLEAASAAEASTAGSATSASRLEAGAASEAATGTASRNAAVTETATASDSTVAFSVRIASVTEIASIIDTSNGSVISPTSDSVTEAAAAVDNSTATSARTDGVVESALASEASLGRWLTSSSVSEAAAASEQSTGMRTQYTSVTEVASLSELSSLLVAFAVSRVEAGAASEVINVVAFVGGSVTESGALAEMVVGSVGIETIYEPVTATDVVSALRALDAAGMRVYAVAAEDRLYVVEGEDRSVEFPSEDRGVAL